MTTVVGFVFGAGMFTSFYLMPVFVRTVQGFTGTRTGTMLLLGELATFVVFPIAGWLVQRYNPAAGIPAGPNELYDLTTDPDERTNRIDDPAQQPRIRDLHSLLEEWFAEQVSADKDGRTLPVGGGGQLRPVGGAWADGSPAFTANDRPPSAWWRDK